MRAVCKHSEQGELGSVPVGPKVMNKKIDPRLHPCRIYDANGLRGRVFISVLAQPLPVTCGVIFLLRAQCLIYKGSVGTEDG